MPNWKKVITSGSDAILNSIYVATTGSFLDGGVLITSSNGAEIFVDGHITASGNISGSGQLFASLSLDSSNYNTVMYNTTTGQFFYTGSYGGGGGGGGGVDDDWLVSNTGGQGTNPGFITSSRHTRVDHEGFYANSGSVAPAWGLASNVKNATSGFRDPDGFYANSTSTTPLGYSGLLSRKPRTYVTAEVPQPSDKRLFPLFLTGEPGSQGAPTGLNEGYPYNYLRFHQNFFYIPGTGLNVDGQTWVGNDGGGGVGPVPEDFDDYTPGLVINGGLEIADYARVQAAQTSISASISRSIEQGKGREAVIITPKSGLLFFDTGSTLSISGSYLGTSASMQMGYDTGSRYLSIKAGTTEAGDLKEVFFVSKSGNDSRVGIGTKAGSPTNKMLFVSGTSQFKERADFDDRVVAAGRLDVQGDFHNTPTRQRGAASTNLNTIYFTGNLGSKNAQEVSDTLSRYTPTVSLTFGQSDGGGGGINTNGRTTFAVEDANLEIIRVLHTSSDGSRRVIEGVRTTSNPSIEFFTDATGSVTGALSSDSSSAQIKFDTGSNAIKFFAGSTDEALQEVLHVSRSGVNPRIGVGTSDPIRAFDFKEIRDDNRGGEILIRGSRSTKGADIGDEVGRINFSIDSSSFGKLDISGSAAEIVALVDDIDETGVEGSLSLRVAGTKELGSVQRLKLIGPAATTNIEFTGSAKFDTDVTIEDDLTVNDFALINAARIGSTLTDPGDGVLVTEDYGAFLGGVHVGGTSDPGTNNLLVDGTLTVDGLVTLGDTNTDTVIISGSNFKLPNLTNTSTPAVGDKILTLDADTNIVQTTGQTDLPYIRVADGVVPTDSKILMFTGSDGTKEATTATGITYHSNLGWQFSSAGATYDVFIANGLITNLTAGTGTFTGDISAVNGSFSGDVTIQGDIIAENYIVSSSVTHMTQSFSSGSTIFGDSLTDTHLFTGSIDVTGSLATSNDITASGDIISNTFETISTTLASDSATNVDTFASSSYNGAIYDYILKDTGVGARAGQFMVAHDGGSVTFTDTSTKHLTDSTIPEITADINGADVRVRVTNGNGYTFKSFVKKL